MSELAVHPQGEESEKALVVADGPVAVDTFGGRVHVTWDPAADVTPLGQLPFFIEYLKVSGLFDAWVAQCPLQWNSPNAPRKRDVLGTLLLAVLSGHSRYAHINGLRGERVNAALLGMEKVVSEDSVRRSLLKLDEEAGVAWMQRALEQVWGPILSVPWILDADVTVKPLFGHQEGAVVGYNPHKPGRPSHSYHTYQIASLRLMLDVEVQAGNQTASKYSAPGLWELLRRMPRAHWPALIRGDRDWGTEGNQSRAEQEGVHFLFKQRMTTQVKRAVERLMTRGEWTDAGAGWEGSETTIRLVGWGRSRRAVVLRRRVKKDLAVVDQGNPTQLRLSFTELCDDVGVYEYAVLVTSLDLEILAVAQLYRDRANAENSFDELKNHWGWGGFTTQDLGRSRIMARTTALIYNWWSLYVRLIDPHQHTEAITSRPQMLYAIAQQTRHGRQTQVRISHPHAQAPRIAQALRGVAAFFKTLTTTAEQLPPLQRWCCILSRALIRYLNGRQIQPPPGLPAPV